MTKQIQTGLLNIRRLAVLGGAALVTSPVFAAVDVTEAVTEIKGAAGPIALIGGASLVVIIGIKVYKWVRRAA